ncbi:MAG: hypothetical protein AAF224_10290 [Pseudomonadota bacterium]
MAGAIALMACISNGGAAAQTANQTFAAAPFTSISAPEVVSMLSEFGITGDIKADAGAKGTPLIVATTTGGAKFLVGFLQCQGVGVAARCGQAMVTTMQSSAGVVYDDLNVFNGTSSVTTVVYEQSQQILIFGRNIFMPGGVGRENFKLQIALFLTDMTNFLKSRSGAAASVALTRRPNLRGKIDAQGASQSASSALAKTPLTPFHLSDDGALEVEIAISNGTGVDYAFDGASR